MFAKLTSRKGKNRRKKTVFSLYSKKLFLIFFLGLQLLAAKLESSSSRSRNSSNGRFMKSNQAGSVWSSSTFASSSSSFASSPSTGFFNRSTSPTRVSLFNNTTSSPSVRFSFERSVSPSRSISSVPSPRGGQIVRAAKKTCMCSPTTHPGSFRCSLHKNTNSNSNASSYSPNRLNARRSAMTNSLVRIGTVEGDLVKRALAALIRPSSHQQRRRTSFRPRLSRLSVMSTADEL